MNKKIPFTNIYNPFYLRKMEKSTDPFNYFEICEIANRYYDLDTKKGMYWNTKVAESEEYYEVVDNIDYYFRNKIENSKNDNEKHSNFVRAEEFWKNLRAKHFGVANLYLGKLYNEYSDNKDKTFECIKASVEDGNSEGINLYIELINNCQDLPMKEYETFHELIKEYAMNGNIDAMFELAKEHLYEKYTDKDAHIAIKWFELILILQSNIVQKAAVMTQLGIAHEFIGTLHDSLEDFDKAYHYFLMAEETGHAGAETFYYLGQCYRDGHGVVQDNQKAYEYLLKCTKTSEKNESTFLKYYNLRNRIVRNNENHSEIQIDEMILKGLNDCSVPTIKKFVVSMINSWKEEKEENRLDKFVLNQSIRYSMVTFGTTVIYKGLLNSHISKEDNCYAEYLDVCNKYKKIVDETIHGNAYFELYKLLRLHDEDANYTKVAEYLDASNECGCINAIQEIARLSEQNQTESIWSEYIK